MTSYTTPATKASGNTLAASDWNTYVRDNFIHTMEWTGWAPTVTQSSTVARTVTYGQYNRIGDLIIAQCILAITASGTSSNKITVSLPVTATQSAIVCGQFIWFDAGNTVIVGAAYLDTTTTVAGQRDAGGGGLMGVVPSPALANNDVIRASLMYQAA